NQEMWIDQENWFVLKMIGEVGNETVEVSYTDIEFGVSIADEKFDLDLPNDVDIIDLEDMAIPDEVTLTEAADGLEHNFLYIPEGDELEISTIGKNDLEGIINRTEIDIDYEKDDLLY